MADSPPSGAAGAAIDAALRAAQDRSPDPFELLSALRRDGRIADFRWDYVNPAAAALLGHNGGSPVGCNLLAARDVTFQAARCAHWSEVLEHGEPRRAAFSLPRPDGTVAWFESLTVPLDGERVAVHTRDVTERRKRGPGFGWTEDLLSSVSHELRTPLNAIVGWAHLLGRAEVEAKLTQRAAEAIGRNARALASMVDDLLDINRIVTGTLALDRRPCDLAVLLRTALQAAQPAAQTRWVRLQADEVADSLPCRGDPKRLEQLFGNLLTRALQSSPLDGTVHVSAVADGRRARVRIRDSGDATEQPALHDRFGEADSAASRRHGGIGFGLAIVRSLVELHGGRLDVAVGAEGTRVEVELPLAEAATAAGSTARAAASEAEPGPQAEASPLAWRRILVLEDEADSLELMTVLLRQQGAIVQAFDNAEQALAAAENGSFDLIISDLGMSGMDGLEFMRRLKRRPVPVKAMALTAYAGDAARAQALDAGYTRVEVKPISPPEFLAVVSALAR